MKSIHNPYYQHNVNCNTIWLGYVNWTWTSFDVIMTLLSNPVHLFLGKKDLYRELVPHSFHGNSYGMTARVIRKQSKLEDDNE